MIKRRYFLRNAIQRAKLGRLTAKAVDLAIVAGMVLCLYPVGLLLGAVYLALGDSYKNGQSLGKKLLGLRVISLDDGASCHFKQSTIRNLPFLLPLLVSFFIPFWGVFIGLLIGVPMIGFELYVIMKLDSGHRLGDIMADTSVVSNNPDLLPKKKSVGWFPTEQNPV